MLSDASRLKPGAVLRADICVVGGGAAGITLALELMDSGLSVLLLESGDFAFEATTQRLYSGDEAGSFLKPESEYLTVTRLRIFGGSTNHWGGWCRPLDRVDFERRSWVEDSGWPITPAELDPYYERVNEMLGLPPFDDDGDAGDLPLLFPRGSAFETTFFHVNAVRFSRTYAAVLQRARRKVVRVVKHANLTEIEVDENGGQVTGVTAASLAGNTFRVRARAYVLATGGIENARLLLASNRVAENGLGNDHDLVGRYFMEHPIVRIGHVVSVEQRFGEVGDPYTSRPSGVRRARVHGCLRLRGEDQRRHRLLNGLFVLRPLGHAAFPELTRQVGQLARELSQTEGGLTPTWELAFASEQVPNRASRVQLLAERDALGMPRASLDWQVTEHEIANVQRSRELLAAELGASFRGRLHLLPEQDQPFARWGWSNHHMGTTRMAAEPKRGVVDLDSRVHGIANLYVAGSSVFPTSGCSNPTLTLLALTVRLADHLRTALA